MLGSAGKCSFGFAPVELLLHFSEQCTVKPAVFTGRFALASLPRPDRLNTHSYRSRQVNLSDAERFP
jgi:hypothetical protein